MQSHTVDGSDRMLAREAVPPLPWSRRAPDRTHNSGYLLQRTQALLDDQPADPSYWTAYDYAMLEREARAVRRAYLGGLLAGVWRRLRGRVGAGAA
jgi:hypothetical protein